MILFYMLCRDTTGTYTLRCIHHSYHSSSMFGILISSGLKVEYSKRRLKKCTQDHGHSKARSSRYKCYG
jgi:hypothetical protein